MSDENVSLGGIVVSVASMLHHYMIDLIGCLVPGVFFCFCLNGILEQNAEYTARALGWTKPEIHVHVLIILCLCYVIGFLFYRRSLTLPDSVSQMITAMNKSHNSLVVTILFYMFINIFGSFEDFLNRYQKHFKKVCDHCRKHSLVKPCFEFAGGTIMPLSYGGDIKDYLNPGFHAVNKSREARRRFRWTTLVQGFDAQLFKQLVTHIETKKQKKACRFLRRSSRILENVNGSLQGIPNYSRLIKRYIMHCVRKIAIIFLFVIFLLLCIRIGQLCGSWIIGVVAFCVVLLLGLWKQNFRRFFLYGNTHVPGWRDCPQIKVWENCRTDNAVASEIKRQVKLIMHRCPVFKAQISKYPYDDYCDVYLHSRKLKWLYHFGWHIDGKCTFNDRLPASKRVLASLKARIEYADPSKLRQSERLEAHIRLASALWYICRTLGLFCVFLAFFYFAFGIWQYLDSLVKTIGIDSFTMAIHKICKAFHHFSMAYDKVNMAFNKVSMAFDNAAMIKNLVLAGVFSFISYSAANVIHYLRLKELHLTLEIYHLLSQTKGTDWPGLSVFRTADYEGKP